MVRVFTLFFVCAASFLVARELSLPNGINYIGQVKNGKPQGKGRMIWPAKARYPNEFSETTGLLEPEQRDIENGFQEVVQEKYVGDFSAGLPHGTGVLTSGDASHERYSGMWKNGLFHGTGEFTLDRLGYKYSGQWVNGKREGRGSLDYMIRYYGEDKKECGVFASYEYDEKIPDRRACYLRIHFEGEFKDDRANGAGKCRVAGGPEQACTYRNGKRISDLRYGRGISLPGFK